MAHRRKQRSRENPLVEVDTTDLIVGSLVLVTLTTWIVWPSFQIRRLHQLQLQNAFRAGQASVPVPVAVTGP